MGVCQSVLGITKEKELGMSGTSAVSGIKNGLALQIALKQTLEEMFDDPTDPEGNTALGSKIVTGVICAKLAAKAVGAPEK
jgi:hypothetical protein